MLGYDNGMKVKGGWHGVAVLTFWFGTGVSLWAKCLGSLLFFVVFMFGVCLGDGSLAKRVA